MQIKTPIKGRLVWGHPAKEITARTFDDPKKGQPLLDKQGNPYSEYAFGVAVPKTDASWPQFFAELQAIATSAYPDGSSTRGAFPSGFAWKVSDGDDPKYAKKEGYPGHWVANFKNINRAPKIYKSDGAQWLDMVEPLQNLKTGDYIWATASVAGNGMTGKQAGIFMNPESVALVGYGEEIRAGQTAAEAFGSAPPPLPPGASSAPVVAPPAMAAPVAQRATPSVAPPVVTVAPDMGFVNGPTAWVMTPKAGPMDQAQLTALGMTEATARAQGYIV